MFASPASDSASRQWSSSIPTTVVAYAVSLAVGAVLHDTLVGFLTSGCQTCRAFWDTFRSGVPEVPGGARLVVVTRGPEAESPAPIASLSGTGSLAEGGVPVVMSWSVGAL